MYSNVTIDEMFPRAEVVMRPPLPVLKTDTIYDEIKARAAEKSITLSAKHMEAIDFVLDFYEHCDDCENARKLADMMDDEFTPQGGRKYLYRLFPDGPLSTIHDLADLPALRNQNDKSFGTSF
uniref:TusE/DsrC/DsvC family sulfur relay protein n=1 Tax=uncultured Thiotrichaceae bacterium TaxID=298394 RepID=A0A6S6S3Z4_9GAMM|nr:MAG: Unknown protein [uncultured Thiotrichaceae bacterium]